VRGEAPAAAEAAPHARALGDLATQAARLYPAGSGGGLSRARDAVWSQPAAFAAQQAAYAAATAVLVQAAAGADPALLAAAFGDVALACKGCHDRFVRD
jgi:cytochrome c556